MTGERKPLGRILLTRKLVSREDLEVELREQSHSSSTKPLASRLIERGLLGEDDALRALAEQFGVPAIDVRQVRIVTADLSLLPRDLAVAHLVLPVLVDEERLVIAMADPSLQHIIDELEFVTGKKVFPHVALTSHLETCIDAAYAALEAGLPSYEGSLATLGTLDASRPTSPPPGPEMIVPSEARPSLRPGARSTMPRIGVFPQGVTRTNPPPKPIEDFSDLSSDAPPPDSQPALSRRALSRKGRKRVLVVDDDDDIRKMLARILDGKGYEVLEASRGQQALHLLKTEVPDLVILDAMLPELHGFDIARRLKASEKYASIPVIMVSAIYRGWRIAEDMKASCGIYAFIEKPFKISDIVSKVEEALLSVSGAHASSPPRDAETIGADARQCLDTAIASYQAGDLDGALTSLERGIQLDPLAHALHYQLALLYAKKGAVYEAIHELERSIELHDRHFPSLKNLAILYERAGFRHKAVEVWERCVHVAPDATTKAQVKEHLLRLL